MDIKNKLYIISGLGADERIFHKIDFTNFDVTFIKWIPPQKKESIRHYAARIRAQIKEPQPVILGISFGGMMAVELSKVMAVKGLILLASAKTKHDIPFYFRWIGSLRLHRLVPSFFLKSSNPFTHWFFGLQHRSDKDLLKAILRDTDSTFLRWAIDKSARWSNTKNPEQLFHIHGSSDRILPLRFITTHHTIKGAGHLIPLTHPKELEELVEQHYNEFYS